ncbi:MAG TPA: hypothetical protein VFZ09_12650 [Archangium sp.]|nr:hypothetical protein [Archangium sp.]
MTPSPDTVSGPRFESFDTVSGDFTAEFDYVRVYALRSGERARR